MTAIGDESSSIVPTVDIDHFWHMHILDTSKYAADCEQMFGHFLHHFPYLGMRSEDDKRNLQEAFVATGDLFEQHFGIRPQGYKNTATACKAGDCGGCDHRGVTQRERPRLELGTAVA